jgi:hypothetical protein
MIHVMTIKYFALTLPLIIKQPMSITDGLLCKFPIITNPYVIQERQHENHDIITTQNINTTHYEMY